MLRLAELHPPRFHQICHLKGTKAAERSKVRPRVHTKLMRRPPGIDWLQTCKCAVRSQLERRMEAPMSMVERATMLSLDNTKGDDGMMVRVAEGRLGIPRAESS